MNEETTNSSLRTGSQSTISELPTISPLAITDKLLVENDTGTYNTTVGDIAGLAGGGVDLTPYALKTDVDAKDAELQTNIDAISKAELTPDADVLGTEEILSRKADGTITTINQSLLAGSGGGGTGGVSQEYVDAKDLELKTSIDTNTANIDTIINAPLTPDADVLGTEEILSRKADGTITTINQAVLAGSGGGELPDLTEYAKLEDLDTATNFTAINPTLDTPAPEVLDKVVTDIENEVKTNTTAITDLTGRVTNLENSGGGGGVEFVEPIYIPIVSADINTADASIIVDLSAYPDNTSFCIDIDILDTEAIFIINIIGTDTLNGFLEELYLRGNIGVIDSMDTKVTSLYIEGVKKADIHARVLRYGIKCRCTINQISDIFYYAKFDENGGYIDAIFSNNMAANVNSLTLKDPTDTFFLAFEPVKLIVTTDPKPSTNLAYTCIRYAGGSIEYYLDVSLLIIDSFCKANGEVIEKIYAQDNVQDYLMYYGRATYLRDTHFSRYYASSRSTDSIYADKDLQNRSLLDTNFSSTSGKTIRPVLYAITAIGRFGKLMDVGKMTEQA